MLKYTHGQCANSGSGATVYMFTIQNVILFVGTVVCLLILALLGANNELSVRGNIKLKQRSQITQAFGPSQILGEAMHTFLVIALSYPEERPLAAGCKTCMDHRMIRINHCDNKFGHRRLTISRELHDKAYSTTKVRATVLFIPQLTATTWESPGGTVHCPTSLFPQHTTFSAEVTTAVYS
jgi:hypothetical protein